MNKKSSPIRSLAVGLATLLVLVVFAYGFSVTNINFEETRSERRVASLTRILRALAHPKIFDYQFESVDVEIPFYLGCPEGGVEVPDVDRSGAFILTSAGCAEPKGTIVVEGHNFQENSSGPINFVGFSAEAPEGVLLQVGNFQADAQGNFQVEVTLPNRQVRAEPQAIRVTGRVRVGGPEISREAQITWEKIVETVFMALLATTFGTMIAIPISFFAARNLMSEVRTPLSNLSLSLIGWPLGIGLGIKISQLLSAWLMPLFNSMAVTFIGALIFPVLGFLFIKWRVSKQKEDAELQFSDRLTNLLYTLVAMILAIASILFLGKLLLQIGSYLTPNKEVPLYFIRKFIFQVGDIVTMFVPVIAALVSGGILGGFFGKIGQMISDKLPPARGKILNLIITPIAGALIAVLIMQGVDWFYQFNNPAITIQWPAIIGALTGLALAIITAPKQSLPVGIVLYGIIRTILNGTRSIEALVMAIVFVAWVGLGPFAGALALALHTVASNAKLYSEQVESILQGPLEAIQSTGANRLQTIVFAVVPQIIPPYISYTMYRWDINVRMSTIIGFVGGGGIGFILQQNINLLNYRAASVNMLAIAIVVATMDYISSVLREKYV
ncbi:MAG: ABC transporter permease subunit [Anaerolineales bacterium]|nr:MAG: ABC transporter permease subunit [Anaerolineales bacterium]